MYDRRNPADWTQVSIRQTTKDEILKWMGPRETFDTAMQRALEMADLLAQRMIETGDVDPRPAANYQVQGRRRSG